MTPAELNPVKAQVAAHWNQRAATFDDESDHIIHTAGERVAWDRMLDIVLAGRQRQDALDAGCGTGFLALELAQRGHRVTGIDFAPAMVERARRKAKRGLEVRFEEGDAEELPFDAGSFDLVVSRHLLWTLPHPEEAIDEWIRVLRPDGRLMIVDGQFNKGGTRPPRMYEYAAIAERLPFIGGRPRGEIEALLGAHGLVDVTGDSFEDLVAAQEQRARDEGREVRPHDRYAVWGDVPR
ncbi:MAG TPA: methyltransferase domain-containing protein [Dehalococcoidia bacterium]|nr:methyltransferase domain-containing protein [Dehalococcoidia bacterium]